MDGLTVEETKPRYICNWTQTPFFFMIMCVTYCQIRWRFCWVVFGFVFCLDTFSASSCSIEKLSAVAAVWVLPSWALQFGAVTRHNKLGEYRQQGEACALVGARAQLLLQDEASGFQRQ